MKKLILLIIFLFCLVNVFAEETVSVSTNTAIEDNFGVQAIISTDTINTSTSIIYFNKSTDTIKVSSNTMQVNNSTDTISISTNIVSNDNIAQYNIANSTDTVNVSSAAIDITKPLKYKEVKADKNIEVSSTTVIPDENDLGTYYSSGAIVEKPQNNSNYDLNLPTTTALGIAGDKVLDKLKLNKSTDTINMESVGVSTTTEIGLSSSTITQEDKKEKDEDKDKSFTKKLMNKLPFDSKLQLSGRKLIGVNYSGTMYDNEESGKRTNSSDFSMEQELQMKIKGSVGDRLELNVDFDDTQEDKKDIYILYKGKGNEFVREAAFGDINVELPSTEFSGYSKELFGAKVDTQYKGLKTRAFFSKTKGFSESKQFKGSSKMEKKTIADTSYIKYKYYSIINDPSKTIRNNTAKVYLDKIKTTVSDYVVI